MKNFRKKTLSILQQPPKGVMVAVMKDAFVMLEGDIVQWAHAQAAARGTSVSRLLSTMLRERMDQVVSQAGQAGIAAAMGSLDHMSAMAQGWSLADERLCDAHWPRRVVDDD